MNLTTLYRACTLRLWTKVGPLSLQAPRLLGAFRYARMARFSNSTNLILPPRRWKGRREHISDNPTPTRPEDTGGQSSLSVQHLDWLPDTVLLCCSRSVIYGYCYEIVCMARNIPTGRMQSSMTSKRKYGSSYWKGMQIGLFVWSGIVWCVSDLKCYRFR